LSKDIEWISQRTAIYYNKLKLEKSRFKKEDLVYLLRRNIKIIKPNNKLNHKKFGPFKVKRNIKNISYKLYLSFTIRIYSIFYIFLLELANLNTSIKPAPEIYFNL
jgi:hypothetical protein